MLRFYNPEHSTIFTFWYLPFSKVKNTMFNVVFTISHRRKMILIASNGPPSVWAVSTTPSKTAMRLCIHFVEIQLFGKCLSCIFWINPIHSPMNPSLLSSLYFLHPLINGSICIKHCIAAFKPVFFSKFENPSNFLKCVHVLCSVIFLKRYWKSGLNRHLSFSLSFQIWMVAKLFPFDRRARESNTPFRLRQS